MATLHASPNAKLLRRASALVLLLLLAACGGPDREWQETKEKDVADGYQDFLKKYPDSKFSEEARQRLEKLEWERTASGGTRADYLEFARKHADSPYTAEALAKLEAIDWQEAKAEDSAKRYEEYLSKYPAGQNSENAVKRIAEIAWEAASRGNQIEDFESFLKNFPDSEYAGRARAQLKTLRSSVAEMGFLVYDAKVKAKGSMKMHGCPLLFSGEYETIGEERLPQSSNSIGIDLGFVPGVQHAFSGEACLPGPKAKEAWLEAHLEGAGTTLPGKSGFFFVGLIKTTGKVTLSADEQSFSVRTIGSSPLTFVVTKTGYRYVSGAGEMILWNGKRYRFP